MESKLNGEVWLRELRPELANTPWEWLADAKFRLKYLYTVEKSASPGESATDPCNNAISRWADC
jgi:hypothetical protein